MQLALLATLPFSRDSEVALVPLRHQAYMVEAYAGLLLDAVAEQRPVLIPLCRATGAEPGRDPVGPVRHAGLGLLRRGAVPKSDRESAVHPRRHAAATAGAAGAAVVIYAAQQTGDTEAVIAVSDVAPGRPPTTLYPQGSLPSNLVNTVGFRTARTVWRWATRSR